MDIIRMTWLVLSGRLRRTPKKTGFSDLLGLSMGGELNIKGPSKPASGWVR
jgi:hypothetical protein